MIKTACPISNEFAIKANSIICEEIGRKPLVLLRSVHTHRYLLNIAANKIYFVHFFYEELTPLLANLCLSHICHTLLWQCGVRAQVAEVAGCDKITENLSIMRILSNWNTMYILHIFFLLEEILLHYLHNWYVIFQVVWWKITFIIHNKCQVSENHFILPNRQWLVSQMADIHKTVNRRLPKWKSCFSSVTENSSLLPWGANIIRRM